MRSILTVGAAIAVILILIVCLFSPYDSINYSQQKIKENREIQRINNVLNEAKKCANAYDTVGCLKSIVNIDLNMFLSKEAKSQIDSWFISEDYSAIKQMIDYMFKARRTVNKSVKDETNWEMATTFEAAQARSVLLLTYSTAYVYNGPQYVIFSLLFFSLFYIEYHS